MTSLINDNKVAFFLLVLVIVGLLTILAISIIDNGNSLAFAEPSIMRFCVLSDGVCTG